MKKIILSLSSIIFVAFAIALFAPAVSFEESNLTAVYTSAHAVAGGAGDGGCCGGSSGGGSNNDGGDNNGGRDPDPTPACIAFKVHESTVAPNETVRMSWTTLRVTSASINNDIGSVPVRADKKTFTAPSTPGTYTYVLTFNGKTSSLCQDTLTVEAQSTPSCDAFSINKSTVAPGESIAIDWDTTNVSSASINRGVGAVNVDGPTTVNAPTSVGTYEYVLTFDGQTSNACRASVTVENNPTPRCDFFTINKSVVQPGESFTMNWETSNISAASINRGVGTVNVDGSKTVNAPTSVGTYEYVLTFDGQTSNACRDTITVQDTPNGNLSCSDIDINASDRDVRPGDRVTLSWVSTGNVSSVSINAGIGSVPLTGSERVTVDRDTTYTFTIDGLNDTKQCEIFINTTSGGGGGGNTNTKPYCDIDISDSRVRAGEAVTLSWRTWNTDEITIEDSEGTILLDSDDEDDLDGEMTIRPTKDLEFTLTAIDGKDEEECEVDVDVTGGGVTVTENRFQPAVAGISLTQVPYTGFEAGPMLTVIFYILLAAWGLFVAYIVALRKGIIAPVSFAGATAFGNTVEAEVAPVMETEISAPVAASTVEAVPSNLPTGNFTHTPVVGYAAAAEVDNEFTALENQAHEEKALFSSDAIRHFTNVVPVAEQATELSRVIAEAKATFPNEDGWVVINLSRLESLLETQADEVVAEAAPTPTTAGSLAEAIVTGNVVAAYQMIAHRPMIALADAAAELDTVLRIRNGATEQLSEMMTEEAAKLSDEQIRHAVHALTSALDGTYTSEEDAVKMAIMKAVKVVA